MGSVIREEERQATMSVALLLRDELTSEPNIQAENDGPKPSRNALPDLDSGAPEAVWQKYFKEERTSETVSRVVLKLVEQKAHSQVIAAIEQALLAGYSQPWMYEVLAFSMRNEDYPQAQIDRVLLSNIDFGASDVPHLLMSAAYLNRLDAKEAALKLYKQAAELLPSQVEAFVLGLKVAEELKDSESIAWAANGILVNAMDSKYQSRRIQAESAFRKLIEQTKESAPEQSEQLASQLASALKQDLRVKISWSGAADLDLTISEPDGTLCSLHQPQTINGGQFLHDGFGPEPKNCYEEYVVAQATPGVYQLRIQHILGDVVGNRFRVKIWRNAGSPEETIQEFVLPVGAETQTIQLQLPTGRRTALLEQGELKNAGPRRALTATEVKQLKHQQRREIPVATSNPQEMGQALRQQGNIQNFAAGGGGGTAVGYQPEVTNLSEGVSMTAMAVVSADRRYVRISTRPVFSNITDVFTFGAVQQNP
ncbi:hypothetical protein Pla110_38200 [Polystyrenella longa]|uniref:Tetratricopeptide repeat protein n=1 Tax=Polystyrenella longa TaxID=2528007 RepID=A0A518CS73_9PLAN|nr:hypothetical protein [Polystyrenella longa]QDU82065.1 hypothetical protein Pla110_38200 [Polystyrenella longa]